MPWWAAGCRGHCPCHGGQPAAGALHCSPGSSTAASLRAAHTIPSNVRGGFSSSSQLLTVRVSERPPGAPSLTLSSSVHSSMVWFEETSMPPCSHLQARLSQKSRFMPPTARAERAVRLGTRREPPLNSSSTHPKAPSVSPRGHQHRQLNRQSRAWSLCTSPTDVAPLPPVLGHRPRHLREVEGPSAAHAHLRGARRLSSEHAAPHAEPHGQAGSAPSLLCRTTLVWRIL